MNGILKKTAGFLLLVLLSTGAIAQESLPHGWHLLDLKKDGFYGISMDKAYEFVKSKGLKSTPVTVGIIDSGIDTTHEDLKDVLWVNTKEIPGNGIDDDHNGYIDDVHGWNFLGSRDGKENVDKDSFEAARLYWKWKSRFDGKSPSEIPARDKADYTTWLRAKSDVFKDHMDPSESAVMIRMADALKVGDETIRKDLKKDVYTCKDLQSYNPPTINSRYVREIMIQTCKGNENDEISNTQLLSEVQKDVDKVNNGKEAPPAYRAMVVKDNYDDLNDRFYGNGNVYVSKDAAMHGTHVAGIIGAERDNGKGMNGVADNVRLMSIRAVPDGDEHDKDIALAIRYAVDNGARVINMSFGKGFSPEKKWVDDAVRYAVGKNVLLVHAAGNDAKDVDTTFNYPSAEYLDGSRPATWITVGASGDEKAGGLVASFSNYGKKDVDVFAPGVKIYSTVPGGDTYQNQQGTSMASPVVAGMAAFIMSYYPGLSALQVKQIIMQTVSKPTKKVKIPGANQDVPFSDLCVSGGIINAYEAIKLADNLSASKIKPAGRTTVPKKTTPVKRAPRKGR